MMFETPGIPFDDSDNEKREPHHKENAERPRMLGNEFIVKEIRRGGMGEVYICSFVHNIEEEDIQAPVALKTFQRKYFFNHHIRRAFLDEVKIWMKLQDILFVLPALGVFQYNHQLFVLMQAVTPPPWEVSSPEVTLRDILQKRQLTPEETLHYSFQMAFGMQSAQEVVPGLIHGDLKPENLLMWAGAIHISDFGLSQIFSTSEFLLPVESTWAYQAPECWHSNPTPFSDIYSFGVIVWEMLFGSLPFTANTREEWKQAHTNQQVDIPPNFVLTPLGNELMVLAKRCLSKVPDSRPENFQLISQELRNLAKVYDLEKQIKDLIEGLSLIRFVTTVAYPEIRTKHISGLLELGHYDDALEALDSIPTELYTDEHWWLRGNALSLTGKDHDALICFQNALSKDVDSNRRWHYLSDYALSLKRTGQYEDAISIFQRMLMSAPKDFETRAVINLATVYLEQGNPREVIPLLSQFLGKNPHVVEGWANLARGYREVGRLEDAAQCFQKAVSIAPTRIDIKLLFVDFCMLDTGELDLAWATLDNIYNQGYNYDDWYVRFQACNKLLGNDHIYNQLMRLSKQQLPDEDYADLEKRISELVQRVQNGQGKNAQTISQNSTSQARPESQSDNLQSVMQDLSKQEPDIPQIVYRGLSLPYLNFRVYADEDMYSIDFYYPIDSKVYKDAYAWSLRYLNSQPEFLRLNLLMRTTPLYFTQCPNCEIFILTNRDYGKELNCRVCSTRHNTIVFDRGDLKQLLSAINMDMKKELVEDKELVHVFVAQVSSDDVSKLAEICSKHGFSPVSHVNGILRYPLFKGLRSGVFDSRVIQHIFGQMNKNTLDNNVDPHLPIISGWQIRIRQQEPMYVDGTALIVEKLLRELRVFIRGLRSVAAYFDPTDNSFNSYFFRGEDKKALEVLRSTLAENPLNSEILALFISTLLTLKEFREAKEKALVLVQLQPNDPQGWLCLGFAYRGLDEYENAIGSLKKVLEINPLDIVATSVIANCFEQIGDTEQANSYFTRLQGLGGNIMEYNNPE